jgi:predicted RND superfamily exporter protein
MAKIMTIAVIVVFVMVLLNTTSYLHPVVMLLTIGVAIALNMGTNIFRGTISSITQLVASVLQLAVSMDYSIVLLTNFGRYREKTDDQFEAMVMAMTKSFPVILSSAAVTFFGFLSLAAMQFLIGADMGIALAKGIVCSFFSITLFMPCILYNMRNAVEKTSHKPFFKSFNRMAKVCRAGAVPALIIAVVLAVPALKASGAVSFTYGSAANIAQSSQVKIDGDIINQAFGESQTWAIMVPEGNWSEENALVDDLKALPTTKSVLSYSTIAGSALPHELADESQIKQLLNNGWSRIVLTSNIPDESKSAFDLVTTVRNLCQSHYGDNYKLVGNAVSYADIKAVTTTDNTTVKMASILAIGAVLLVMFKSISIPIILVSAIEVSIWINEAVPYFTGDTINFVAFLVIDAVQLGAAVDYAIIFTEEYLARRKRMNKKDAAFQSVEKTAQPIITSSSILILACIGITVAVSSPMIQQVGELIARGAFISVVEIFFVLPLLFSCLTALCATPATRLASTRRARRRAPCQTPPPPRPQPSGGQDTHRPRDGHRPPQTFGVNSNDHQEQEERFREERPLAWAQGPRGDHGHAHGLYDVRAVWRHAGAGRRGERPVHRAGLQRADRRVPECKDRGRLRKD